MQKYKMSKKYILKIALVRIIVLVIVNIICIQVLYKILGKYDFIAIKGLYYINIIGLIFSFIMPCIEYLAYKYIIDEKYIEIKRGILFRKSIYIPREKIKYIIVQRDPLDYIFKISSLKMYTTAGNQCVKAVNNKNIRKLWNIMDLEVVIK